MKNYSSIKDPKDIVTKEYVDNLIGDINTVLQNIISQQELIINLQHNLGTNDGPVEE